MTRRRALPAVLLAAASLAALAVAACSPSEPEPAAATAPDVVMILIDTFRPDHLGVRGYPRQTAPFLEGLLERSTVFGRAFSTSSWTAPATSSLFTALYPTRHGVTEGFLAHQKRAEAIEDLVGERITLNRLPEEVATLPELLRAAGYATYGLASNLNIGREIGFDRGFDRFETLPERTAATLGSQVRGWRAEMEAARSYFLYLHLNDVHEPYRPRQPWYEETGDELGDVVAAYDSEISYLDAELAKLYEDLGWGENTLVVMVSDHGEEFREHGQIGHQFTLYDELMRVLLAFHGPGLGLEAREVGVPASLVDVVPTVLDLLGLPVPAERDGRSLVPALRRPETSTGSRPLFAHRLRHRVRVGQPPEHLWAVVRWPWKLVEDPRRARLFHLEDDPGERTNVAAEHPEVAAELARELERFRAGGFRQGATTEVELDAETLQQLKSLGYLQD